MCAGERSADLYAAAFVRRLLEARSDLDVAAVGGDRMGKSGAEIVFDFDRLMTFGLSESLSAWRRNYACYGQIARLLRSRAGGTFIAVAYPGLNLPLCRLAKRWSMNVLYLLPPQIWAWGGFRARFVRRWVDLVVSMFPFEARYYEKVGIPTALIENPLVGMLSTLKRTDHRRRIGFMPGSRSSHLKRNMELDLHLARFITSLRPDIELCFIAADREHAHDMATRQRTLPVLFANRHQLMKNCDLLLVSSGTASLEAAIMGVTQVFFHRPTLLDDRVLRRFVTTNELNLANLCFGRHMVPSYITNDDDRLRLLLEDAVVRYL